jgi:hypothetical protein
LPIGLLVAIVFAACIDAGPGAGLVEVPSTEGSVAHVDWQRIPLRELVDLFPAHPQAWQVFARAVGTARPFTTCAARWEAPPGIKVATTTLELRLRSRNDALRIEDVVILESNPADAVLEQCVDSSLRGREFPAPGMPPHQAYRYKWSAIKQLE